MPPQPMMRDYSTLLARYNQQQCRGLQEVHMTDDADDDVKAITTLISVLKPLDPQARIHILDFVFKRLGISLPAEAKPASTLVTPPSSLVPPLPAPPPGTPPSVV